MTDEEFLLLNEVITDFCGLCFPASRKKILEARLRPRLEALRLRHYFDYYLQLEIDRGPERAVLARLVSNNETYFFRGAHHFEALLASAAELRRARRGAPGPLAVLSAGCSSGEEPYTLNLYGMGAVPGQPGAALSIDAFDIDEERVRMAQEGRYRAASMRAVEAGEVQRYFLPAGDGSFALRHRFRQAVRFGVGNILDLSTYPGRGPYDAVFCRNVMIYFSESALHRAIDHFAAILRPGGLLFLGHSESIIGLSAHFETVRFEHCLAYRRREG